MSKLKSRSRRRSDADYFSKLKEEEVKQFFDTGDHSHLDNAEKLAKLAAKQCDPDTGHI